jgi:hypothetical protein
MISRTRIQFMSSLILGMICQVTLGNEPNDVNEALRFEVSPVVLPVPQHLWDRPEHRKPTYAAGIAPEGSELFFAWPRGERVGSFLNFVRQDKDLSLQQKEFLEDTEGLLNAAERSYTFLYPKDDPNHPQALLYAMSLPDAKRMGQLYLQFARREYKRTVDWHQRAIQETSGRIAEAERHLPEVEKSLETSQKAFDELKAVVSYRSEQEALEAIGELDRMLNTAQVEIAGIRARIEVIQSYQREERRGEGIASKLELMFIEEAVAMRGAEARRQMATELRTRASRYIELTKSISLAAEEKNQIPRNLEVWRERLQEYREKFATLKEQEPKIRENTVLIYHVRGEAPPITPLSL